MESEMTSTTQRPELYRVSGFTPPETAILTPVGDGGVSDGRTIYYFTEREYEAAVIAAASPAAAAILRHTWGHK